MLNAKRSLHRSSIGRPLQAFSRNRLGDAAANIGALVENKEPLVPVKTITVSENNEVKTEIINKDKNETKEAVDWCSTNGQNDSKVVDDDMNERQTNKISKQEKNEKIRDVKENLTLDRIFNYIDQMRHTEFLFDDDDDILVDLDSKRESCNEGSVKERKDVVENDSGYGDSPGSQDYNFVKEEHEPILQSCSASDCSDKDCRLYVVPGSETPESMEFDLGNEDEIVMANGKDKIVSGSRGRNMTDSSGVGTASEADGSSPTVFIELIDSVKGKGEIHLDKCNDLLLENLRMLEYERSLENGFLEHDGEGEFVVVQKKKKVKSRSLADWNGAKGEEITDCLSVDNGRVELKNSFRRHASVQNYKDFDSSKSENGSGNGLLSKSCNQQCPEGKERMKSSLDKEFSRVVDESKQHSDKLEVLENSSKSDDFMEDRSCNVSEFESIDDVEDQDNWTVVRGVRRPKEASVDGSTNANSVNAEMCRTQTKASVVNNNVKHPRNGFRSKMPQYSGNGTSDKSDIHDSVNANNSHKNSFPLSRKNGSKYSARNTEHANVAANSNVNALPKSSHHSISFGPACRDMDTFNHSVTNSSQLSRSCCPEAKKISHISSQSASENPQVVRTCDKDGSTTPATESSLGRVLKSKENAFNLQKTQQFLYNAYEEIISLWHKDPSKVVMFDSSVV